MQQVKKGKLGVIGNIVFYILFAIFRQMMFWKI